MVFSFSYVRFALFRLRRIKSIGFTMCLVIGLLPLSDVPGAELDRLGSDAFMVKGAAVGKVRDVPSATEKGIVGRWVEELEDSRAEVVFREDGTFSRTIEDASGRETVEGTYSQRGNVLIIAPEGSDPLRFEIVASGESKLVVRAEDGTVSEMVRSPHKQEQRDEVKEPAAGSSDGKAVRKNASRYGEMVPEWVRPGMRLTFYLMTGSLPGSVNGWVPDEEGRWFDQHGNRYSQERKGYSSHGLLQATVAGMDAQTVALSQQFYLFNADDTTPFFKSSLDDLVTPDTGGDYWMHPAKQAALVASKPWDHVPQPGEMLARHVLWKADNRQWKATAVTIIGEASRTTYIYDQETGCLLYLSRLTRHSPEIRDPSQSLPDTVSYATFLRFISMRQLNLPWLSATYAETAQHIQHASYQGAFRLDFPGAIPTPTAIAMELNVLRKGADWTLFQGRSHTQGIVMPDEFKAVQGPGCTPPLIIPPSSVEALAQGLEIDRDPATGFSLRISGMDGGAFTLTTQGPRQHFTYVYDRRNGLMVRRISREILNPAAPNMVTIKDLSLRAWR